MDQLLILRTIILATDIPMLSHTRSSRSSDSHARAFLPRLESLEDRLVLDLRRWINPSAGSWHVAANWEGGILPGEGDDVLIGYGASPITYSTGASAVQSLSSERGLDLTGGRLSVNGSVHITDFNGLDLRGGTLHNARVDSATTVRGRPVGGTLDRVTVQGVLDLTGNGANHITVVNGLTLNGTARVGSSEANTGRLRFQGTQTLEGTGAIVFGFRGASGLQVVEASTTLTIGEGITIRGGEGTIGYRAAWGGTRDVAFVNRGTILANAAIGLDGTGWRNVGTIASLGFSTVQLLGAWRNEGSLAAAGTSRLILEGTWSATTEATVTAEDGARVELRGTANLTGGGLNMRGRGTYALLGTLADGPVNVANDARLSVSGGTLSRALVEGLVGIGFSITSATFDGATFNGLVDVVQNGSDNVRVTNGLTVNGTLRVGDGSPVGPGRLDFVGSQTLAGMGTVMLRASFQGGIPGTGLRVATADTTLTIGLGLTVQGNGTIGAPGGNLPSGSVVNQGTLIAQGSGFTLNGPNPTNRGVIQFTRNTGTVTGPWTNAGSVTVRPGAIATLGAFTTMGAAQIRADWNGIVDFTSSVTGTGAALTLSGPGQFRVRANWTGGTVNLTDGALLQFLGGGTRILSRVTLNGDLELPPFGDASLILDACTLNGNLFARVFSLTFPLVVAVRNGLTLNGTAHLLNPFGPVSLRFEGTQTVDGTGTISLQGRALLQAATSRMTLILGPDITVRGIAGTIGFDPRFGGPSDVSILNRGTIRADGGEITVDALDWRNEGTLEAAGGILRTMRSWTNAGSLLVSAGSLELFGPWTTPDNTTLYAPMGAAVSINGLMHAGRTLFLDGPGSFGLGSTTGGTYVRSEGVLGTGDLANVTVHGSVTMSAPASLPPGNVRLWTNVTIHGNLTAFTGVGPPPVNPPVWTNVTLNGEVDIVGGTERELNIRGGLTLNGTMRLGTGLLNQSTRLRFLDTQTLSGAGTIVLGEGSRNGLHVINVNTTLTIGPGIVIRGARGFVGCCNDGFDSQRVAVIIHGIVQAALPGSEITVNGTAWRNEGLFLAANGGELRVQGTNWTNAGTFRAETDSRISLFGTPTNFANSTLTGGVWQASGNGILQSDTLAAGTLAAEVELDGVRASFGPVRFLSQIAPTGTLWLRGGVTYSTNLLANAGTLFVTEAARLTVGTLNNTNTLFVGAGSTLTSGRLANLENGTLTGGVFLVAGLLQLNNTEIIRTLATALILDGPSAAVRRSNDANVLPDIIAVAPTGFLALDNGHILTISGQLTNAGLLAIGASSTLLVGGTYTQTGVTQLAEGRLVSAGLVNLHGGLLTGSGRIIGNVRNNALLEVGGSAAAGVLVIDGNYTQTADGALSMELGDLDSDHYDRLDITGAAELDGVLFVTLLDDFFARAEDIFTLLTATTVTGTFATLDLPELGDAFLFEPISDEQQFALMVVRQQ